MKKFLKKTLFVLVALLFPLLAFADAKVGEKAPDFNLTDTQGKSRALSEFTGKIVVLEWFNEGCPFVKKHYESGAMQALQKEFKSKGVVWLLVSSSAEGKQGYHDAAGHNERIKEWNIDSDGFLLDSKGDVGKAYGAKTTPHMFIISKEGNLVYAGAIDDKASTDKDDLKDANNYVVNALNEILEGKPVSTPSTVAYGCSVKYAF